MSTSIQKVLISYDDFVRLKEIEKKFDSVNSELLELKRKLGNLLYSLDVLISPI